jgi:hypothetical protein
MAFDVEYFELTGTDATNEYISLSGTPVVADNVAIDLVGGTAQALSGDFGIDGTRIVWDSTSYNLNGLMATGDKVRAIYDRS